MECNILLHRHPKKSFKNESFPFRTAVADRPLLAKTKEGQRKRHFTTTHFQLMQDNTQNSYYHSQTNNSNATIVSDMHHPLLSTHEHKNHIHNKISTAIFHTKDSSNLLDHRLVSMLQAQTRITPAVTDKLVLTQVLWIIDIQATVIPETYFIYQLESVSMHTSW